MKTNKQLSSIQEINKHERAKDSCECSTWKEVLVIPGTESYDWLWKSVCTILDDSKEEKTYWSSLLGTAVVQVEEEKKVLLSFANDNYGGINFIRDMEHQGELSIFDDGSVMRKTVQFIKRQNT